MNDQIEQYLPQLFKYFNRFMILMWRTGLGPVLNAMPPEFGRYIVLHHTGRKSGLRRSTPVNYAEVDGALYVTAGFGAGSQWYKNIMANPHIDIWMTDGWFEADAEDITDSADRLALMRTVLKASGFASKAAGINPHTISDADLDTATAEYRLLKLTRGTRLSGEGSPGDLMWVWGALAGAFVVLALLKPRKK